MKKNLTIDYQYFSSENELSEIERTLYRKALEARENAYAPYSSFLVGCAILLENGEIIIGNNQENAAYPSGTCAERSAIYWTAANFPNEKIVKLFAIGAPAQGEKILIPAPPCGACRQSILEYESKQKTPIEVYFANLAGEVYKTSSISDLLPFTFDKSYL